MKRLIAITTLTLCAFASQAVFADTALWEKNCASCHGKDGKGDTKMGKKTGAKDYTDPAVQAAMKEDQAFKSVKEGLKENGEQKMKPFAEKLTDDQIKTLIAHIRTFKK